MGFLLPQHHPAFIVRTSPRKSVSLLRSVSDSYELSYAIEGGVTPNKVAKVTKSASRLLFVKLVHPLDFGIIFPIWTKEPLTLMVKI